MPFVEYGQFLLVDFVLVYLAYGLAWLSQVSYSEIVTPRFFVYRY